MCKFKENLMKILDHLLHKSRDWKDYYKAKLKIHGKSWEARERFKVSNYFKGDRYFYFSIFNTYLSQFFVFITLNLVF